MYPGHSATVFVALAFTGGTPMAVSTGKLINVPPPASAFTAPAPTAAAAAATWASAETSVTASTLPDRPSARRSRRSDQSGAGRIGAVTPQPLHPIPDHERPEGVDDATVDALGKLSEALEVVEHARGLLYGFHRLSGMADFALGDAVVMLRDAGHEDVAVEIETDLVGRNVLQGRWTFQLVEEYDDGYYDRIKALERQAREQLAGGRRHLYEAELKASRITPGRQGHEPAPVPGV